MNTTELDRDTQYIVAYPTDIPRDTARKIVKKIMQRVNTLLGDNYIAQYVADEAAELFEIAWQAYRDGKAEAKV